MAQSIDIEVDDRGIRKLLLNLQKRMKDMTPVFREIGEIILESVQNNIREGESPDGKSWPQSIRAKVEGGQTLMDTPDAPFQQPERPGRESTQVTVGSNWKYAHVHQLGAIIRPKRQKGAPVRPRRRERGFRPEGGHPGEAVYGRQGRGLGRDQRCANGPPHGGNPVKAEISILRAFCRRPLTAPLCRERSLNWLTIGQGAYDLGVLKGG